MNGGGGQPGNGGGYAFAEFAGASRMIWRKGEGGGARGLPVGDFGVLSPPAWRPLWPFLLIAMLFHIGLLLLPRPVGELQPRPVLPRLELTILPSVPVALRPGAHPSEPPLAQEEPSAPRSSEPAQRPAALEPSKRPLSPVRPQTPVAAAKQKATPNNNDAEKQPVTSGLKLAKDGLEAIRAGRIPLPAAPVPDPATQLSERINAPSLLNPPGSEQFLDPSGATRVRVRAADGSVRCFEIIEAPGVGGEVFPMWVRRGC